MIPARTAQHLKTLHLISNRVERLSGDAFAGLPQLHSLHIEHNPIKCDCLTHHLFKGLRSANVYPKIACAKPANLVMTASNVHQMNVACGKSLLRESSRVDGGAVGQSPLIRLFRLFDHVKVMPGIS